MPSWFVLDCFHERTVLHLQLSLDLLKLVSAGDVLCRAVACCAVLCLNLLCCCIALHCNGLNSLLECPIMLLVHITDCRIHNVSTMPVRYALRPLFALQGHKSQILCLTFSPDATKMVTASKDGTWRVWNIDVRYHQQEDAKCMLHHTQEVSSLCAHHTLLALEVWYISRFWRKVMSCLCHLVLTLWKKTIHRPCRIVVASIMK